MNTDIDHPFFRPLWRRVAVIVFCLAWVGWELYNQSYTWALIVGGMAAYGVYVFFIAWNKDKAGPEPKDTQE